MDTLQTVVLWIVEFVLTTLIEIGTLAIGWNIFLCMAWTNLPSMDFAQLAFTAIGMKFIKFSLVKWYKRKE